MKLQIKLALYNALTKLAIILFTGLLILLSLENITYKHMKGRLEDKKNELINHLSSKEISQILSQRQSFTDYNILKEEYIYLKPIATPIKKQGAESFITQRRTIGQSTGSYLILTSTFNFNGQNYLLEIGDTLDTVMQLKHTIKEFTLLMLVVALSLTLVIDLIFTKYLLAPFYKIIDRKLVKVNDPMNFDYDKITTTTRDFEMLDESISALMKKISDLFILEKQFIANVSHELLTPISIISSRLENVLVHDKLSEEGENKIYASLKTLNRLKAIINSLLLISKVENNQFNKDDEVMIAELVNDVCLELEDRMEDKKIHFVNLIKDNFVLPGNKSLMQTLLFNIINNAIKYNSEEGSITVIDRSVRDKYILEFSDTGIGMNQQQIETAFNRFEKFGTDEKESYGLGLAIVKSITAFHGIMVEILSENDLGTTIRLEFDKTA